MVCGDYPDPESIKAGAFWLMGLAGKRYADRFTPEEIFRLLWEIYEPARRGEPTALTGNISEMRGVLRAKLKGLSHG